MRITVHSVAGKMPKWVNAGVDEYSKRLPKELKLQWRDVPLAARAGNADAQALKAREGAALLRGLRENEHSVALDPGGQRWTTEDLAEQLRSWMLRGRSLNFLIGGPDGLSDECLGTAGQCWSLGPMTLPHPVVRIVLAEQLYRAWTITIGHPYHRA